MANFTDRLAFQAVQSVFPRIPAYSTAFLSPLLSLLLLLSSLYVLHRRFIPVHFPFRTIAHLGDLPGPPPRSLLTGNLAQLFSPTEGPAFHLMLGEVYGGVVRVWGFFPVFGVLSELLGGLFKYFGGGRFGGVLGRSAGVGRLVGSGGEVYVSDPRAISVILGKEGECFDETGVFLECVPSPSPSPSLRFFFKK
jgi:hypothetical protein